MFFSKDILKRVVSLMTIVMMIESCVPAYAADVYIDADTRQVQAENAAELYYNTEGTDITENIEPEDAASYYSEDTSEEADAREISDIADTSDIADVIDIEESESVSRAVTINTLMPEYLNYSRGLLGQSLPVYSNDSNQQDSFTDSLNSRVLLGYATLKEDGSACFEYVDKDNGNGNVRIPRMIVVSHLDGEPWTDLKLLDYTDGHWLCPSGNRLNPNGTHFYPPVLNPEDEKKLEFIGEYFNVTELSPEVFRNCEQANELNIPWTVTSDIDYTFFKGLNKLSKVNIYAPHYEANKEGRYISEKKKGDDIVKDTSGVLVDLWNEGNISAKIIYCPPHIDYSNYLIYNTGYNIIGPHAFENCENLITVSSIDPVFQNVVKIEDYAFSGCSKLEHLPRFFTQLITYIGDRAFAECTSLKEIDFIPSDGTKLGKEVFYNTSIEKLSIPRGYNQMDGTTFKGMKKLKSIDIPLIYGKNTYFEARDGILYRRSAPDADFDDGVTMVCFPAQKEVTAKNIDMERIVDEENAFLVPYQVEGFDDYCFNYTAKLETIYFPGGLRSISNNSFYACEKLRNLYFYSGLPELYNGNEADWEEFKKNTNLFSLCNIERLHVYAGIDTPIYDYALNYVAPNKENMDVQPLYDATKMYFEINSANTRDAGTVNLKGIDPAYSASKDPFMLVIPNFVYLDENGKAVNFKKSVGTYVVTGLNSGSLADENLTKVRLLHNVKNVAQDAFYIIKKPDDFDSKDNIYCKKLEYIYVEDGNFDIQSIDGVLYQQKYNEESKKYDITGLLDYPSGSKNTEYTTRPEIFYLPQYAFWGAKYLKHINIYDCVKYIGRKGSTGKEKDENACFAGCDKLITVNIIPNKDNPTSKRDISYYSKDGVLYTVDYSLPDSTELNALIFYPKGERNFEIDGLSPITYVVDDRCRRIQDMKNCKYLRNIIIPNGVEIIDPEAFLGDVALDNAEFLTRGTGKGIQTVGKKAFYGTALKSVSFPNTIRSIGDEAYADCQELKEVNIAGDVLEKVGRKAFYSDGLIEKVAITGTNPSRVGGNVTIGESAFEGLSSLKQFSLNRMGETIISNNALYGASSMTEFSSTGTDIKRIGEKAFAYCTDLKTINLRDSISLYTVSAQTFYNCRSLDDVKLPNSITSIENEAFAKCVALSTINTQALTKLKYIGNEAFANTAFRSFYFPQILPTYGENTTIQEKTKLGRGLFKDSKTIKSIFVPDTVDFSDYTHMAPTLNGPFYNLGPDVTVFASGNSSIVDYFIMLDENDLEKHPVLSTKTALPVVKITLTPSEFTVYDKGDNSRTLTAVLTVSGDLTDYSLEWASLDTSVADIVGDIDTDGRNTFSATIQGISPGITQISVLNKESGEMAYAQVRVIEAKIEVDVNPTSPDTVSGITVSGNFRLNTKGSNRSIQLNAVTNPVRTVYFESKDKKLVKVNKKGKITAGKLPKGQKEATTQVICYAGSKDDNSYTETVVNVTVCKPSIIIQKKKVTVNNGGNLEDRIAYLTVSHDGAYDKVTWSTKKRNIATVSGDNEGCTITGISKGTTVIIAECNGLKAKCKVKVTDASIFIDTDYIELYTGGTNGDDEYQISAKTTLKGKKGAITWASSDEKIATVNEKGIVTAVGAGICHITATANGVTATCVVKVLDRKVKILGTGSQEGQELTELIINSEGDNTYQLDYDVEGEKPHVTWYSDTPGVADVDQFGFVTGRTPGDCIIYAEANGTKAGVKVHVINTYARIKNANNIIVKSINIGINEQYSFIGEINGADRGRGLEWQILDGQIAQIIQRNGVTATIDPENTGFSANGSCIVKGMQKGTTRLLLKSNGITTECIIIVE